MEKIAFRNNLDYEAWLSDDNYTIQKYQKIVNELEYIYFFIEQTDTPLFSIQEFDKEYLVHLEKLLQKEIRLTKKSKQTVNWWGKAEDRKLEQQINSKITSHEIEKKMGISNLENSIITNFEQLNFKTLSSFVLKEPLNFSGRGNIVINKDNFENARGMKLPLIQERLDQRINDYGITCFFNSTGNITDYFVIKNHISSSFGFVGGEVVSPINFDITKYQTIVDQYFQLGARDRIQFDSYEYIKNSDGDHQICQRLLVEANYRRTMGELVYSLNKLFGQGFLILLRNKNNLSKSIQGEIMKNDSLKLLSPSNKNFILIYSTDSKNFSLEQLNKNLST